MAFDDLKVERGEDGRMLASGWHGYACPNCGCYHIELFDDNNTVFAALAIEDEALTDLAHALLAFAAVQAMEKAYDGKPH